MVRTSDVPTPGQIATMCARCQAEPRMPRTARFGPHPIYCETCRRVVTLENIRAHSRRVRADPERRPKAYALVSKWQAAHPERIVASHRRRRYGLEPEHVATWLEFQNGVCGLCGEPLRGQVDIDHDHETGVVRGLLHNVCNANLDKHPNAARYKAGWLA